MIVDYQAKRYWKGILLLFAIFIAISSLFYTNNLVNELSLEERKKMNLLADAYKRINDLSEKGEIEDITFLFEIIRTNENIPLILTDSNGNIMLHEHLDSSKVVRPGYLEEQLNIMQSQHDPITINYVSNDRHYIYYKDSKLITQLRIYPYVQLFLVILFILISYFAFSSSWNYEQNKVWTGMSKETAHQLGTPLSSLMALLESIKDSEGKITPDIINELDKDINRLKIVTNRFSKIGYLPYLESHNVEDTIRNSLDYLSPRISNKISIDFHKYSNNLAFALLIPSLFDWVIENICINAINAMEGSGSITIFVEDKGKHVNIDITDTGKGIPRSKHKTIFNPGFTTNVRGWGLGLSLSKRIIGIYHKGSIYVKWSEIGKGTTFRIKLRK